MDSKKYTCICKKTFTQHQSLYRHRQTCDNYKQSINKEPDKVTILTELLNKTQEQVKILQQQNNQLINTQQLMQQQINALYEQNNTLLQEKIKMLQTQLKNPSCIDKKQNDNNENRKYKNKCKSEWCNTMGNNKYEGYCMPCFVNNPENNNKPVVRNYKTKEKDVADRIMQSFSNVTWVADKRVQDGCSRRRPDLLLDMGSHIIIVEVDENKHANYDCSCENKRMMELSQDLQHRPIVFIRFNPDEYTTQDGTLMQSCWKLNKRGVMQIDKSKQNEWEQRIDCLKQQIKYWIDNPTEKTIEIIELFY